MIISMPKRPHPKPNPPRLPSPPDTHWANVADWYDTLVGDDGSEYHQHVVIPGTLRLLNLHENPTPKTQHPKPPLHILDLACGQGVLSRKLASLGHTVTALDAAAPLITAAKRRNESDRLPIHYAVADATKLLDPANPVTAALPLASFDAITLILAIQNITPLSPVWQACRELLKPHASLILVMMHPCFRIPRQSDWLWQDKHPTLTPAAANSEPSANTSPAPKSTSKPTPASPHTANPPPPPLTSTAPSKPTSTPSATPASSSTTSKNGLRTNRANRALEKLPWTVLGKRYRCFWRSGLASICSAGGGKAIMRG